MSVRFLSCCPSNDPQPLNVYHVCCFCLIIVVACVNLVKFVLSFVDVFLLLLYFWYGLIDCAVHVHRLTTVLKNDLDQQASDSCHQTSIFLFYVFVFVCEN